MDNQTQQFNMGKNINFLEDNEKRYTIDSIQEIPEKHWNINSDTNPSFGFSDSIYWLKRDIKTRGIFDNQWLIEVNHPILSSIEFFLMKDGMLMDYYHTGSKLPFDSRPLEHRSFLFPLKVKDDQNYTLYLRISSDDSIFIPITLYNKNSFIAAKQLVTLLIGSCIGCLLAMGFYNLFLHTQLKHRIFTIYFIFIISAIFFDSIQRGYAFQYLWPENPEWNRLSVPLSVLWVSLMSILFVTHFLRVKKNLVFAYYFYSYLSILILALGVLLFFISARNSTIIASIFAMVTYISLFACAIMVWLKGINYAKYITIGWGCLMTGAILLGASRLNLIPSNIITENSALVGAVIEAILASFAIGNRISYERTLRMQAQELSYKHERDAQKAQEALLQKEKESNKYLESLVTQRTQELSNTLDELNKANRSLKESTYRDPLTGLYNRRYLHNNFTYITELAIQRNKKIVTLFVDIDFFKKVNDTHGHLTGDICINIVASVLSDNSSDESFAFRYGGEEFLMVKFVEQLEESYAFAENIRTSIFTKKIPNSEQFLSVSIGVSQAYAPDIVSIEKLIQESDVALYDAKANGRNRVRFFEKPIKSEKKPTSQT
ncbi:MAG: diguanylate cyclase [Pseudomonadota bacterium]